MEKHRQPSYRKGGKKTGTVRETRRLRFRDRQSEMGWWRQKKGIKAGRAQETRAGKEVPVGVGGPRDQGAAVRLQAAGGVDGSKDAAWPGEQCQRVARCGIREAGRVTGRSEGRRCT